MTSPYLIRPLRTLNNATREIENQQKEEDRRRVECLRHAATVAGLGLASNPLKRNTANLERFCHENGLPLAKVIDESSDF